MCVCAISCLQASLSLANLLGRLDRQKFIITVYSDEGASLGLPLSLRCIAHCHETVLQKQTLWTLAMHSTTE